MVEALTIMRVAKYFGVAPWELMRQPVYWYEMGSLAVSVETAQYEKERKAAEKRVKS